MTNENEIILYYVLVAVTMLLPLYIFLLVLILKKEHRNELKKAKENQKKINCNGTGASNTLVGLYQSTPAYTPVTSGITEGYSGTQFVEDEMTLKARKQLKI